jgi:two-component system chemotaxis sensor kinase CheA
MSDNEFQIDREMLVQTFVTEAEEALAGMERDLVALEAHPDDGELVHSLFRAAHTLKGSARLVSFDAVSELAHELEALLERVRAREVAAGSDLVTLVLRTVDHLRAALADAAAGRADPTAELVAFRERLHRAAETGEVAPEAALPEAATASAGNGRTLRVDVAKLDRMLNLAGEIAISRGRLTDILERRVSLTVDEILEVHRESDRLYLDLQELIMKARMVPIGPVFQQHLRTVRDLAQASGKQVRLTIEGTDVEVDTAVVEQVRDPLTHMVRNAIDHGLESPEERRARGKASEGHLALRAFHDGGTMVIQVADDGAGLDRSRIARKAAQLGLVGESSLSEEELARVIFEPGFSTSEVVTAISGRGVGLDVVRRNVEALHGTVGVSSEPGRGTTVTMRLPLTLAIIQGFRVRVGEELFIIPLDAVVECVDLPASERNGSDLSGVLSLRGLPLPYLRLRRHLDVGGALPERESVVVVRYGTSTAGLAVDTLLGESQTVIKPLGRLFQGVPGVAGSSIMGDGRVALILDVPGLMREALRRIDGRDALATTEPRVEAPAAGAES